MRPLKFRAWDKKLKEWVSPDAVSITLSGVPMAPYETWMKHNLADLVVSQFTGLLDRHGKEIWEGDIVKWDDTDFGEFAAETCPIEFKDGSFCHGDIVLKHIDMPCLEVIGNIYAEVKG